MTVRLVTAMALAIPIVAGSLFLDTPGVAVLFGLVLALSALEWASLSGVRSVRFQVIYVAATVSIATAVFFSADRGTLQWLLASVACLWWCAAIYWVVAYQLGGWVPRRRETAMLFIGWLILIPAWLSLVAIHERDWVNLLLFFSMVWIADGAAYYGGRYWGRRRLASRISPGKTWEGVLSAMAGVILVSLFYALFSGYTLQATVGLCILAAFVVFMCVVGDPVGEPREAKKNGCKGQRKPAAGSRRRSGPNR